jgi:hypothetical protein
MSDRIHSPPRRWPWVLLVLLALLAWVTATASGRTARRQFFAALRIARPQGVSVTVPAFSGPTGTRRLQDAVAAMLADSVHVVHQAADSAVANAAAASRVAGFAPALLGAGRGTPRLTVEGARTVAMTVDGKELQTIFTEAGRSGLTVPTGVDGAALTFSTPAAIRAEYGHCPTPEAPSLRNQIATRPPPSADNSDCVILLQRPVLTARVPAGLDMAQLTGIALEIAGMSPNEARDFQAMLPWPASLSLTMPRFMRSYDRVTVHGGPGILLNVLSRRGPTYELIWAAQGRVYTLTGYDNAATAVPLADSMPPAPEGK